MARMFRAPSLTSSNPNESPVISRHLDASLDGGSSADELGPENEDQTSEIASTPARITPKKRGRPSFASKALQIQSPPSENDIIVKERDGHRIKLVLYNEFRCGRCKSSGQDCTVEIGRKGSHVVRCELCIARNQSVSHCTLPLRTLLDLDEQNPHLQYTISKIENSLVKKNGKSIRPSLSTNSFKEGETSINAMSPPPLPPSSNVISDHRLREAKARLMSLRKACDLNGDKLIASQLEDIISEFFI